MNIEQFDFYPKDAKGAPISLGLNLNQESGRTCVNLFALHENQGPLVSENLWRTARKIVQTFHIKESIERIRWTYTAAYRTTALHYYTVRNSPYKLGTSDRYAFQNEKYSRQHLYSLDQYSRDFAGQPPTHISEGLERVQEPEPITVFCIPCPYPAARDGVFHCKPAYFDALHMRDNYEFILVDTRKTIAQLQHDDPDMLEHSENKLRGSNAQQWLKNVSLENPQDMGAWTYNERGLVFYGGQAAILKLVQDLHLPYFPITVEKAIGKSALDELRQKIGYSISNVVSRQGKPEP